MKNEIDIIRMLQIADKIAGHGINTEQGHQLDGVNLFSDFDGYNLALSDNQVTLNIYFHNKYQFDYPNQQALDTFLKRLSAIDRSY